MKIFFAILCIGFLTALDATADQIGNILEVNHGALVGHSDLYNEGCHLHVYLPGEFTNDNLIYVEYTFDNSPAYHVAPYPNNGMIFEWVLDQKKSLLTVYNTEDRKDYAQFSFDANSLKIKSFLLPGISCENLK